MSENMSDSDATDQEEFEVINDEEDEIEDDTYDDDSSVGALVLSSDDETEAIEDNGPPMLLFDNKLARFLLCRDWQNIQSHLRAQTLLRNETYLQTPEQDSSTDDNNRRIGDEGMPSLHKAAWILHLFTPAEVINPFLFAELRMARSESFSRFLLQQDTTGNTFLYLLSNDVGKGASILVPWKHSCDTHEQWNTQKGIDTHTHVRIHLYDENTVEEDPHHGNDDDTPTETTVVTVLRLLETCSTTIQEKEQMFQSITREQYMPLHRALRYGRSNKYTDHEVHQLLSLSPEASHHANLKGELPLHLALKHQCPSKVYSYVAILITAHAAAASSIDPVQKLAPFMLAAIKREVRGKTGEYMSCLSSTFALLQTDPAML
jgi:hypothetical protein